MPIANAVNKYNIGRELIETFMYSMEMDLEKVEYTPEKYEQYILGSAEVVGLMCLHVFTGGNQAEYERMKPYAMKLGAAFQKVNFLRDLKADFEDLNRTYFPNTDLTKLEWINHAQEEAMDFILYLERLKQEVK